ncbi:MAG: hypothetical protein FWD83_01185, partial [Promicromonosporaceae bacterium]|nr:hypothetical protein [Promicromonosporaceae bacterium]
MRSMYPKRLLTLGDAAIVVLTMVGITLVLPNAPESGADSLNPSVIDAATAPLGSTLAMDTEGAVELLYTGTEGDDLLDVGPVLVDDSVLDDDLALDEDAAGELASAYLSIGSLDATICDTSAPPAPAWDYGSSNRPRPGINNLGSGALRHSTVYYAFVEACGWLDIQFYTMSWTTAAISNGYYLLLKVTAPDGTIFEERQYAPDTGFIQLTGLRSDTAGVWQITTSGYSNVGAYVNLTGASPIGSFDIIPRSSDGTPHTGRVWTEWYYQHSSNLLPSMHLSVPPWLPYPPRWNQQLYFLSEFGFQYQHIMWSFNGVSSNIVASNLGVHLNCVPQRRSVFTIETAYSANVDGCANGLKYRIFFEPISDGMPESALFYDGVTRWVNPVFADPTLSISYEQTGPAVVGRAHGGDLVITLGGHAGTVTVWLDANDNGAFDDPEDLKFTLTTLPGTHRIPWDGLDGLGNPIPFTQDFSLTASLNIGEFHVVQNDVEFREGGVQMTALNGPLAGNRNINWGTPNQPDFCCDNTNILPCNGFKPPILPHSPISATNLDSTGGVHRWGWDAPPATGQNAAATWGDARLIDEWMVLENMAQAAASVSGWEWESGIAVTKTSTVGDPALIVVAPDQVVAPIEMTFTITNTGTDPLTNLVFEDETLTGPSVTWASCDGLSGSVPVALAGLTLAAEASVTCRGILSMGAALTHRNLLTVTGVGTGTGDAVTDDDDWALNVVRAGIEVVKTSTAGDPALIVVAPGGTPDPIEVAFTITNAGTEAKGDFAWADVTVEGPDVAWTSCDGQSGSVTEVIAALALEPQESLTCRGTLNMGEASLHENVLTITASGAETGTEVVGADDLLVEVVIPNIEVVKTSTAGDPALIVAPPGQVLDPVEVTFTITNTGTEALHDLAFVDETVTGPTVDWAGCLGLEGSVAEALAELTLSAGASVTCTGTVTMGEALAHVNALAIAGVGVKSDTLVTDVDTWELNVVRAGIEVVKTSDVGDSALVVVAPGVMPDPVEVTFTITNTGTEAKSDFTWEDTTNEGPDAIWTTCDDHTGTVDDVIETLTLAPGESLTCRGTLNMGTALAHENTLTVTAVGVQTDTEVSGMDVWELNVIRAGIEVVKTSDAGDPALLVVAPGGTPDPVEVTFTITNTGTEAKSGFTWEDTTNEGPDVTWSGCDGHDGPVDEVIETLTLMPGESLTCRGTLSMGTATTHHNTLTVTAIGTQTDTEVSDTDTWELSVIQAGIEVTKTSPVGDSALLVVAPGVMPDPVEVTFTITNTGTEAKSGFTWEDTTNEGPDVTWSGCD